jgi:uncharacterized protein (DUF1810 family)
MTADDRFDLARFVEAQDRQQATALAELRAGRKRSHWMWFVFPQLAGLGSSERARYYGIGSLAEARAYLAHPTLAANLRAVTNAMLLHRDRSALAILGSPDDLKFHASMTLFAEAAEDAALFEEALAAFFDAAPHRQTLELLRGREGG